MTVRGFAAHRHFLWIEKEHLKNAIVMLSSKLVFGV
jgi:hypothetical protein